MCTCVLYIPDKPSSSSLSLVKGTALNPLQDLVTHLWQRPFGTLYVPRADLELVGLLRSIVSNASLSIRQVTTPIGAELFVYPALLCAGDQNGSRKV